MTIDLAYESHGIGTPVVLLHAFPTDRTLFAAVVPTLALSARIITPDLRGFGESPLGEDDPDLDVVADDVIALIERLDIPKFVVGGVSLGGYLTLNILRRYRDRVAGVVLIDTKAAADTDEARDRRETVAATVLADGTNDGFAEGWLNTLIGQTSRKWRPPVVEKVQHWSGATAPETVAYYQRAMAARPDSFDVLAGEELPALIIVGAEDEITPLADAEAMRASVHHASLEVISGAGHLSPLEEPEPVAHAIADFVRNFSDFC